MERGVMKASNRKKLERIRAQTEKNIAELKEICQQEESRVSDMGEFTKNGDWLNRTVGYMAEGTILNQGLIYLDAALNANNKIATMG